MSYQPTIEHSEIIFIDEILNSNREFSLKESSSVRTLGVLKQIDLDNNLALLEYKHMYLYCTIDSFLSKLPSRINSSYQFIGELNIPNATQLKQIEITEKAKGININKTWILKSRLYRLVEGIDMDLYRESLNVKRKFQTKFQSFST